MALDKDEFEFRLLMFLVLSTEAEKWALAMVGHVSHEFNYRLKEYLRSAERLAQFCKGAVDVAELDDTSEIMSRVLERLKKEPVEKRYELIALMDMYANGEIYLTDKNVTVPDTDN